LYSVWLQLQQKQLPNYLPDARTHRVFVVTLILISCTSVGVVISCVSHSLWKGTAVE